MLGAQVGLLRTLPPADPGVGGRPAPQRAGARRAWPEGRGTARSSPRSTRLCPRTPRC
jgi:hypothetical protein